jgi:hypothetical protein
VVALQAYYLEAIQVLLGRMLFQFRKNPSD